jgi:hypothetical protein
MRVYYFVVIFFALIPLNHYPSFLYPASKLELYIFLYHRDSRCLKPPLLLDPILFNKPLFKTPNLNIGLNFNGTLACLSSQGRHGFAWISQATPRVNTKRKAKLLCRSFLQSRNTVLPSIELAAKLNSFRSIVTGLKRYQSVVWFGCVVSSVLP